MTDSTLIKDQKQLPCGCLVTTYPDGREGRSPCFPCGLAAVANSLADAARMLGAMSQRAKAERDENVMAQVGAAAAAAANRNG
jgi:hypothetical protein